MNDEQMQSALDEWFEDTDPQLPNAQRTATHVMAQVPQTRQRGRWLPFRLFRPKAETPTATGTTEYQPSPIPASNGHSPTVIERTQSMLSPVKAITAGAIVFAIGGVMLVAQPFDQRAETVPAATTAEPSTAVEFTAVYPWGPEVGTASSTTLGSGVTETVGWVHRTTARSSSDPRFDGTMVYSCNSHGYPEEQGALNSCVFRIENDGGAWQSGPSLEVDFGGAAYGPWTDMTVVFEGEGDYEGLTAVVGISDPELGNGYAMHGLIVDGYLPPDAEHVEVE